MPKSRQSDTGTTAIRLIKMLSLIPQGGGGVSTSHIKDRLEAQGYALDVRTVQRDLQTLSLEFPLECRQEGRTNYWYFRKGTQSQWPAMNPDTALAVTLAERNLKALIPDVAMRGFDPIINQARQTLQLQDKSGYKRWAQIVRIVPKGIASPLPDVKSDVMNAVYKAISQGRQLRINKNGADSVINPLGVVLRGQTLYLVCSYYTYTDIRIVAMHRIQQAENLMSDISTPPGFDLDATLNSGIMSWRLDPGKPKTFELDVTEGAKEYLEENAVNNTQVITPLQGNLFRVIFITEDTLELRQWLLGFGGEVTVKKPATVKKWLLQTAQEIAANYAN